MGSGTGSCCCGGGVECPVSLSQGMPAWSYTSNYKPIAIRVVLTPSFSPPDLRGTQVLGSSTALLYVPSAPSATEVLAERKLTTNGINIYCTFVKANRGGSDRAVLSEMVYEDVTNGTTATILLTSLPTATTLTYEVTTDATLTGNPCISVSITWNKPVFLYDTNYSAATISVGGSAGGGFTQVRYGSYVDDGGACPPPPPGLNRCILEVYTWTAGSYGTILQDNTVTAVLVADGWALPIWGSSNVTNCSFNATCNQGTVEGSWLASCGLGSANGQGSFQFSIIITGCFISRALSYRNDCVITVPNNPNCSPPCTEPACNCPNRGIGECVNPSFGTSRTYFDDNKEWWVGFSESGSMGGGGCGASAGSWSYSVS